MIEKIRAYNSQRQGCRIKSSRVKSWEGDEVLQVNMLVIDTQQAQHILPQGPFSVGEVPFMVGWKHILVALYCPL